MNGLTTQSTQIAEFEKRLPAIIEQIKQKTELATSLVCSEETRASVKKVRAELNADSAALHKEFVDFEKQLLAPWLEVKEKYHEEILQQYRRADLNLKAKINEVEDGLIQEKTLELYGYIQQYATSLYLSWVVADKLGIKVNLTASITSLKKKARAKLDRIRKDVDMITSLDNADVVMSFYLERYDASYAITEAHRATIRTQEGKATLESVSPLCDSYEPPTAMSEVVATEAPTIQDGKENQDELFSITFTVTTSRQKLKELKEFLDEGGYILES